MLAPLCEISSCQKKLRKYQKAWSSVVLKSFEKTTSDTIWFNHVLCIWFCKILLVRTFVGKIHSVKKNKHLRKFYYPAKPEQLFKQTFSPQLPPHQKFYAPHTCNLLTKSQEVLVNSQGSNVGKEVSKQSEPGLVRLLRESILSL